MTRSSPLTSALFGYAGSHFMAPLVGSPRLAGDGLGLFLDSWMLARGVSPATAAATDPPPFVPWGSPANPALMRLLRSHGRGLTLRCLLRFPAAIPSPARSESVV